jgi:hypothetical protein
MRNVEHQISQLAISDEATCQNMPSSVEKRDGCMSQAHLDRVHARFVTMSRMNGFFENQVRGVTILIGIRTLNILSVFV